MEAKQDAGGLPGGDGTLAVDPQRGLALLEVHEDPGSGEPGASRCEPASRRVTFEGIALGPGVYVDAAGRRIRVRARHLPLVAARLPGVFLRDLHREDLGASVGVVTDARVEAEEVRFTGDVRLAPYTELIRHFWPHIRFSLGFRYDPARLQADQDGTYDLPDDFVIDHQALVPQGQYPNAKLVRLLNQARGLTATSTVPSSSSGEPQRADVNQSGGLAPAREAVLFTPTPAPTVAEDRPLAHGASAFPRTEPMPDDTKELDQLRLQRDEALKAADKSKTELEQARAELSKDLGKARTDLDAATRLTESARLELGHAKNRFAAEVMKMELAAGKDFDLDQRKRELTGMDLAALDQLRGVLRLEAAEAEEEQARAAPPATRADRTAGGPAAPKRQAMELDGLGFMDTLRLAAEQGVL